MQARPKITAVSLIRTNNILRLQWNSRTGALYQVQGSNDRETWKNVEATRQGLGDTDSVLLDGTHSLRYYRVIHVN